MKKMKSLALLCVVAACSFTACQKEVSPEQNNVTKEKLTGTYKVTAMELKATDGTKEDLYADLPDCEKNSMQTLNANFSWNLVSGCDPADNETNTWQYIDTKRIVINDLMCNIKSFDGKNLVLTFDNFLGLQGTLTETLTKQ